MNYIIELGSHPDWHDLKNWLRFWELHGIYRDWCKKNVGTNNWRWFGPYTKTPQRLRFRHSEDLLAFRLAFGFL